MTKFFNKEASLFDNITFFTYFLKGFPDECHHDRDVQENYVKRKFLQQNFSVLLYLF
jgi:hypothetical protein